MANIVICCHFYNKFSYINFIFKKLEIKIEYFEKFINNDNYDIIHIDLLEIIA